MKAEQSSLYRHLEVLHLWGLETFANAPKEVGVEFDIDEFLRNVIEAQTSVSFALEESNPKQRSDYLDIVAMNMGNVKSITKVLTEYSSSKVDGGHVITKSKRVRLLSIMSQISEELGRWRNKTLKKIEYDKTNDTFQ